MIKLVSVAMNRGSIIDRTKSSNNPFAFYMGNEIISTTINFVIKQGFDCKEFIDKISKHKQVLNIDFRVTTNRNDNYNYDEYIYLMQINIESTDQFVISIKDLLTNNLLKQ